MEFLKISFESYCCPELKFRKNINITYDRFCSVWGLKRALLGNLRKLTHDIFCAISAYAEIRFVVSRDQEKYGLRNRSIFFYQSKLWSDQMN